MMRPLPLPILLAAVAFALSPFFVTNFAGFDPALFPVPQEDPPVQPAGWAFAIWGLLYVWLIVSAAFGLIKRPSHQAWAASRPWLLASLVMGVFWLPLAERSVLGATALIWAMQITAIVALWKTPRRDRWWLQAPVATYAGWLTAASCVSIGLVLAGWGLVEATPAALIALTIALVLGLAVQLRLRRAPGYAAALIWALVAVAVKNGDPLNVPVAGLAGLGAVLFVFAIVLLRLRRSASATG